VSLKKTPVAHSEKLLIKFHSPNNVVEVVKMISDSVFIITLQFNLTNNHKGQRRQFCHWILQQPPSNIVDRIIWTEEKFFCLPQKPDSTESLIQCFQPSRKDIARRRSKTLQECPERASFCLQVEGVISNNFL
ncbi:Hypothetical protein FKW44_017408, partial [Caligus rogercresseyi]